MSILLLEEQGHHIVQETIAGYTFLPMEEIAVFLSVDDFENDMCCGRSCRARIRSSLLRKAREQGDS